VPVYRAGSATDSTVSRTSRSTRQPRQADSWSGSWIRQGS